VANRRTGISIAHTGTDTACVRLLFRLEATSFVLSSHVTHRTNSISNQDPYAHAVLAYGHMLRHRRALHAAVVIYHPQHWLHHLCWHHHNRRRHQHRHLRYWHRSCHVMCTTLARASCPMLSRCSQHLDSVWLRSQVERSRFIPDSRNGAALFCVW
jgi:hypothetical protein